jgi:hypothetical protein
MSGPMDAVMGKAVRQKDYEKIAEYACTIFACSLSSMSDKSIAENANKINIFFAGFTKFCSVSVGLSTDESFEALLVFFTKCFGVTPLTALNIILAVGNMAQIPEGAAPFKAGETAAWECQEGNTAEAMAALGKALGI